MGLIGYNECNYSDDLFFLIQVVGTTPGNPRTLHGTDRLEAPTIYKAYMRPMYQA